jgi:hypothetical protein
MQTNAFMWERVVETSDGAMVLLQQMIKIAFQPALNWDLPQNTLKNDIIN